MRLQLHSIPVYFPYIFIFFASFQVSAKEKNTNIQSIIHLLDYLSKDYPMAVRDGEIIDKAEYAEMQEFSLKIFNLAKAINLPSESGQSILSDLNDLKTFVKNKASSKKIKDLTEKVKWAIIKATGYEVAPLNWPDKANGQSLYLQNCVQCHGATGDGNGNLAVGLKPAPANFLNDSLMTDLSPFEAYNTIKLGVEGTAMRAFTELTDKEAWDLAFYAKSLRFQKQKIDSVSLKKTFDQEYGNTSLKDVATLSDNELLNKLGSDIPGQKKLKALRIFSPSGKLSQSSLTIARDYLHQTLNSYKNGNKDEARQNALAAYLEGIEPVEVRLKANDPEFTSHLEQKMMDVRQGIEKGENSSEVENKINSALSTIDRAEKMMKDEKLNYWLSFFLAASIMLREGLEAFLIIALILALIRSTPRAKKALPYIHGGWITAILMGVAGWLLSDWVINISGKNREIMEGMISLIAVIVLAFVGFWLHNHSHSKKWKEFIEKKVGAQLNGEKMFGLAFFSFMVVFREAFESILFLQAIGLETQSGVQSSIGFGVLAAFALIGLLAVLFLKYSKKIPVRQLFRYSSWIITLLAVILIGKGVHAIQEAGWISVTGFSNSFKIDWLGIYPTLESQMSQLVLLGVLMLLYYLSNYRNRIIKIN
ncbi:high-affinity iron transporter [Flaviramulus basaltis]|uniref:High-affinity iron transporter n=1 Tax=Flaviramulus basaltis TaxID=369401 RepID=A0A1K2IR71_9FLAO|nr:FTR1 family protein [Flaviramulus basaltis]SFZ94746.1 high-affinity iron transporter [Flaviramulus basaltis]